jgi:hypothetical protein
MHAHASQCVICRGWLPLLSLEPQWLSIFDETELQRLLSGDADQVVDVADWQACTVYDDRNGQGASSGHRV